MKIKFEFFLSGFSNFAFMFQYILAVEALQLLSTPSSNNPSQTSETPNSLPHHTDQELTSPYLQPPPLNKHCAQAIKPRALLQYIPPNSLFDPETSKLLHSQDDTILNELTRTLSANILNYETNKGKLPPAHHINYRSLSIGTSSSMDICLESDQCQFLSEKHACIYYDEQTNHYELLNYSEYGTVVDNFLYGLDLDPSDSEEFTVENDSIQKGTIEVIKLFMWLIIIRNINVLLPWFNLI